VSQTLSTEQRLEVRQIVRAEIASLAGLVMRRTEQAEAKLTRSFERNLADEVARATIARIFGEVLADFSSESSEPGE
jgi:hypothetical protein